MKVGRWVEGLSGVLGFVGTAGEAATSRATKLPRTAAIWAVSSLLAGVLVGCGGTGAVPASSAEPSANAAAGLGPRSSGQIKVAHFSTSNGMTGLVLDRSGPKAKLRLDGSADIIELTAEEDRFAGDLRGHFLVAPDGKRLLHVSVQGALVLYLGKDELPITPDQAAEPLPAATITGVPVRAKPAYEEVVARLNAIAVRTKQPSLRSEDSADLSKVEQAILSATADMFVRYEPNGSSSDLPVRQTVPPAFSGIEFGGVARESDEAWDSKKPGLLGYGGKNRGFSEYGSQGNHMNVVKLKGFPAKIASGTVGLVWETDERRAIFVSLDGERYVVDLSRGDQGVRLEPGSGLPEKWPAPGQNALLDVHEVSSLAKAGALPQKAADELIALDEQWNVCAQKTWKGAERAVDSGKWTEADRKDWVKKVETACDSVVKQQEARLLLLTEERLKQRRALFDKARARLAALGVKP